MTGDELAKQTPDYIKEVPYQITQRASSKYFLSTPPCRTAMLLWRTWRRMRFTTGLTLIRMACNRWLIFWLDTPVWMPSTLFPMVRRAVCNWATAWSHRPRSTITAQHFPSIIGSALTETGRLAAVWLRRSAGRSGAGIYPAT